MSDSDQLLDLTERILDYWAKAQPQYLVELRQKGPDVPRQRAERLASQVQRQAHHRGNSPRAVEEAFGEAVAGMSY